MGNPTANVLRGKIKQISHNPPYTLATIELDPNVPHEITVSFIPVSDAARDLAPGTDASTLQPNVATPHAPGDGVTILVPVPNAVIMKGI
jgi:hypothetical protein